MSILTGEKEERKRYSKSWIGKVGNTKSTLHMNTTGIFPMNINEYNYINRKNQNETKANPNPKSATIKKPKNLLPGRAVVAGPSAQGCSHSPSAPSQVRICSPRRSWHTQKRWAPSPQSLQTCLSPAAFQGLSSSSEVNIT